MPVRTTVKNVPIKPVRGLVAIRSAGMSSVTESFRRALPVSSVFVVLCIVPQRCRNRLLSVRRACIASPWCVGRPSKRRLPLSSLLLPVAYRTQSSQSRVSPCRFGLLAPDRPPRELRTAVRLQ